MTADESTIAPRSAPLTDVEALALDEAERAIDRGIKTFLDVGDALVKIRDGRLYRTTYATFEDYCRQRWNLGRNYVGKVIAASEIVAALGTTVPTPASERVARELAPLRDDPDALRKAWQDAVEQSGGNPTSSEVHTAVALARPTRQRPVRDVFRDAVWDLRRSVDRLDAAIAEADRTSDRQDLIERHRGDFDHIFTVLRPAMDALLVPKSGARW